jgi:predicted secreted protein
MRQFGLALAALLLAPGLALAAEQGQLIRAGDLKAQPFLDAQTTDKLATGQAVSVLVRQGGWVQVSANGKTGWLRTLNLKLASGSTSNGNTTAAAARLRTGSSGRTVTTGVKGMGEAEIRGSSIDLAQLAKLEALAVDPAAASAHAAKVGLKENQVAYLKESGR